MDDNNILDEIDMRELGDRLRKVREKQGMTQEQVSKIISVGRTTLIAIEKGERRIKSGELIKLAHAYGRQVVDFINPKPEIQPFKVQFRGPREDVEEEVVTNLKAELETLCRNYLELEKIANSPLVRKYPLEYYVGELSLEKAAEMIALEERNRLGLGDGPIPLLRNVLEQDVGLRIFYLELRPTDYSSIYAFDEAVGGCIAINNLHPKERCRWSLAHEYAHFLVHRFNACLTKLNYQRQPETERFANLFPHFFLMPTSGLTTRCNNIMRMQGKITPADLCSLAYYYGVSVQALTDRLEMLKFVPTGTWERLQNRGFKVRDAQKKLGIETILEPTQKLPIRYQYLAIEALENNSISEGWFAHLLDMDRVEARQFIDEFNSSENEIMELTDNLSKSIEG